MTSKKKLDGYVPPADLARLGPAMVELRNRAGLQQKEIHQMTGMGKSQISRWENGRDVPHMESLMRYLEAIGFDISHLADLMIEQKGDRPELMSDEEVFRGVEMFSKVMMRRLWERMRVSDESRNELAAHVTLLERKLDVALAMGKIGRLPSEPGDDGEGAH